MSKLKSHKGAAKRFKKTGSGKIKCKHANTSHMFTRKETKAKRQRRGLCLVEKCDMASIEQMLPHGK